jgi:hypothetical protein
MTFRQVPNFPHVVQCWFEATAEVARCRVDPTATDDDKAHAKAAIEGLIALGAHTETARFLKENNLRVFEFVPTDEGVLNSVPTEWGKND